MFPWLALAVCPLFLPLSFVDSLLASLLRAIVAIWNSMIAAAFGGAVWCLLDFRIERRWTMVGFCSGTIAGLVAATPSSGYVQLWSSAVIGVVAGAVCNFATKVKFLVRVDDALDLFAEHAVGGMIGLFFSGLFGRQKIIALDGVNTSVRGGWVDHNWKQMYKQIAYICAVTGYAFVVSAILAKGVDLIPGLHLRNTLEAERLGMDEIEIGEFASDYIEIRRDYADSAAPFDSRRDQQHFKHVESSLGDDSTTHQPYPMSSPQLETLSEKKEDDTIRPSS